MEKGDNTPPTRSVPTTSIHLTFVCPECDKMETEWTVADLIRRGNPSCECDVDMVCSQIAEIDL